MKRFWKVLLSVGLIMAFSVPALATDVKFSGSYYVQGWYINNHELSEDEGSRAFMNQRLRVQTVFQVAEGLALTTRFDALEKKWGDRRWALEGDPGALGDNVNRPSTGASGVKTQENIEFDKVFMNFATPIGLFSVGYDTEALAALGTGFLNADELIVGHIVYMLPVGSHVLLAAHEKFTEVDGNKGDTDGGTYAVGGIFKIPGGEAGFALAYIYLNSTRPDGYKSQLPVFNPYIKMTAGPLYVEAEAYYIGGKVAKFEEPLAGIPDIDAEAYGGYVKAQMERAPGYAGVILVYMTGDDPDTTDKMEGGIMPMVHWNQDFNPCLILWNYDYSTWVGNLTGSPTNTAPVTDYMDNVRLAQLYAGFKPNPKLDVKASIAYAKADEKPLGFVDDEYGTEVNLTASYKIYNNLEYMIGAAYLFAGDYFKGTDAGYKIDDNYLLMHKLTLTF